MGSGGGSRVDAYQKGMHRFHSAVAMTMIFVTILVLLCVAAVAASLCSVIPSQQNNGAPDTGLYKHSVTCKP